MQTTGIKPNINKKTSTTEKGTLPEGIKSINNNFRDKFSEMLNNPVAAGKLKEIEKISENTVRIGFEKAVAHFENPGLYPLPSGGRNLENAIFNLLEALPKKRRNKLIDKVNELLKAPAEKRNQVYGDIANIDFRSHTPVADQVKTIPKLKKYSFDNAELDNLIKTYKTISPGANNPLPQQAAAAGKLSFFVDNMTCNNPDDILKDEVNIGGFIIDSLGNTTELAPRFVGKFRKNETVNLGANSRLFTVNIDPFLAQQTFAAGLFIIESDLIENQDALEKAILVVSFIGLTFLAVSLGIAVAGILGAAVTPEAFLITMVIGGAINLLSHYILPLFGDDISDISNDTLALDGVVGIGTEFPRSLTIGNGFDSKNSFDGKYTASARWVAEA